MPPLGLSLSPLTSASLFACPASVSSILGETAKEEEENEGEGSFCALAREGGGEILTTYGIPVRRHYGLPLLIFLIRWRPRKERRKGFGRQFVINFASCCCGLLMTKVSQIANASFSFLALRSSSGQGWPSRL